MSSPLRPSTDLGLLASLFTLELSAILAPLAWYKKGDRTLGPFLRSNAGVLFTMSAILGAMSLLVVLHHYRRERATGRRQFRLTLAMNVVTLVAQLALLEVSARVLVRHVGEREVLLGRSLPPQSWPRTTARYRRIIDKAAGDLSYLVYDAGMGWTVGRDRRSSNGLYFSSLEGLRAPRPGLALATASPKPRVALVGDSYTFGEEVRYEDTWGSFLERELGGRAEVLNFGVPGYGIDQAYLRYERDVRSWNPAVVVFSPISHDADRSMTVYTFLNFPDWELPFSKPRFAREDGTLAMRNAPALRPQEIFSKASVFELPYLDLDPGFSPSDWQPGPLDFSYAARFLRPWFRPWSSRPAVSREALVEVNGGVLKAFGQSAARAGIGAIIAFLPNRHELGETSGAPTGKLVLEAARLAYTDLTPCLVPIPAGERNVVGGVHYSAKSNAAVAKCLAPLVREILDDARENGRR